MAINFDGYSFYNSLIEIVGFKCGVVITSAELFGLLQQIGADNYAHFSNQTWVRIHSDEYEDIVYELLKVFGRLDNDFSRFPTISMYHRYKHDKVLFNIYLGVMKALTEWMNDEIAKRSHSDKTPLDPTPFLTKASNDFGPDGFNMACDAIKGMNETMTASPWSDLRQVEWRNTIDLKDLFESEGLNAEYGTFLDQRYIDFLSANFSAIDAMHWRKFEQLTAEFLDRCGYQVQLGPGRGDDGVDVRAWSKDTEIVRPLIIVQCKRQKASVGKTIIKSLYADVVHEDATSGLLVTTSRLSPGAEQTRLARAYPINVADRPMLRKWISALREPGTGDFQSLDD